MLRFRWDNVPVGIQFTWADQARYKCNCQYIVASRDELGNVEMRRVPGACNLSHGGRLHWHVDAAEVLAHQTDLDLCALVDPLVFELEEAFGAD